MKRSRTPIAGLLLLVHMAQSAPARADEQTQKCGQAFEAAQQERLKGNYRSARDAARACSDQQCPAAIINECVKLFEAVQSEIPTERFQREGGVQEGFKNWENLPATDKMMTPRYNTLSADDIPRATSSDGRVAVLVIAV